MGASFLLVDGDCYALGGRCGEVSHDASLEISRRSRRRGFATRVDSDAAVTGQESVGLSRLERLSRERAYGELERE